MPGNNELAGLELDLVRTLNKLNYATVHKQMFVTKIKRSIVAKISLLARIIDNFFQALIYK